MDAPAPPSTQQPIDDAPIRTTDVLVIGAGQAGLSALHHLLRRGFGPAGASAPGRGLIVVDGEDGPGGAWRHRWSRLTMATVNGIRELPGMDPVHSSPTQQAREAVPAYFADFERLHPFPIERPVHVDSVLEDSRCAPDPGTGLRPLLVRSHDARTGLALPPIRARALLNATGTWTRPFRPAMPGAQQFGGLQQHTAQYSRAEDFAGMRVGIIGGGISALDHLLDLHDHAPGAVTRWYTRREVELRDEEFTPRRGHDAVAGVARRVAEGLPVRSVVSATGLFWTPALRRAEREGILVRHPMFSRILPGGVVEADGTVTELDALLWATGFRHELRHLRGLDLRGAGGGIRMDSTAVAGDPRIHLLGYGPSASTIGANRAGRAAVSALVPVLDGAAEVAGTTATDLGAEDVRRAVQLAAR